MDKRIFIIIGTIIALLFALIQLSSKQEVVDSSNTVKKESINDISQLPKTLNKHKEVINSESSVIKNITVQDDYELINVCGLSLDLFLEKFDLINLESLNGNIGESVVGDCEKWFNDLQTLSQDELKKLELDFESKKELLTKFISFKYDKDTIAESRESVYSPDYDIKLLALVYLLRYDYAFNKEVARNMDIADIGYLVSGNNVILETLYTCKHGKNCSANGSFMKEFCEDEDVPCGVSYQSWLISSGEITINLYDDMMRAVVAIENVLSSNWMTEHPLDI